MSDVTRIMNAIERGDAKGTDELLPLVYEELRLLATQRLSQEKPGQTLQATALVHEAYLRLLGDEPASWNSRGHFFAAAAEAMRRILVVGHRSLKTTSVYLSASTEKMAQAYSAARKAKESTDGYSA